MSDIYKNVITSIERIMNRKDVSFNYDAAKIRLPDAELKRYLGIR